MDFDSQYTQRATHFIEAAKEKESQWIALSEENRQRAELMKSAEVKSYDYHGFGWKPNSNHPGILWGKCDRCDGKEITSSQLVAGCRMNGDGYGNDVYRCETCGLFDFSSYDEKD